MQCIKFCGTKINLKFKRKSNHGLNLNFLELKNNIYVFQERMMKFNGLWIYHKD